MQKIAGTLVLVAQLVILRSHISAATEPFSFDVEIGGVVGARPAWLGSSRYDFFAAPHFRLNQLNIPGLLATGGSELGFSLAPSVGFVSERKSGSEQRLSGLGDISEAYELGAKVSYTWPSFRVFGEMRQGFGGHSGLVGRLGAEALLQLDPRTRLEVGPRLDLAGDAYMHTYFSVAADEAIASGYDMHEASAGALSVGASAMLRHEIANNWAAIARIEYDRLTGDAAAAPFIIDAGRNQWLVGIGLSYRLRRHGHPDDPASIANQ